MKSIFVGNLSVSVTEAILGSLFEAYGTVERVSIIMTDRDTGQAKGFGFVDMSDDGEAVKAIAALNGKHVEGRTLTVNEARPKTDRRSGGGFWRKRWL
jgi:cold-inducible RNA-binding protein